MTTYDPGRLVVVLEVVVDELDRWNTVASDTIEESQRYHRLITETVSQARHRAAQLDHQAHVDTATAAGQVQACVKLLGDAESTVHNARVVHENAGRVREAAHSVLAHWQHELTAAEAWLRRALERLRLAEAALSAAHGELARARSELASAEGALRACQSYRDAQGRRQDCSGPARRVQAGEQWVREAQIEVQRCEAEVVAARQEVSAAETRVGCSQRGVGESERAVDLAGAAAQAAEDAIDHAHWGIDYAGAARQAADAAVSLAAEERTLVDSALASVAAAASHGDNAGLGSRRATHAGDTAQRDATGAVRELGRRMDSLRRLDLPSL